MHVRLTVYRCCPGTYTRGMGGIIQSAGWNQKVLFLNSESGPGVDLSRSAGRVLRVRARIRDVETLFFLFLFPFCLLTCASLYGK